MRVSNIETENNKKNMDINSENSSNVSYYKYDGETSFNLTGLIIEKGNGD